VCDQQFIQILTLDREIVCRGWKPSSNLSSSNGQAQAASFDHRCGGCRRQSTKNNTVYIHSITIPYSSAMCSNFAGVKDPRTYAEVFRATLPADVVTDVWPGYLSSFIRKPRESDSGDEAVPEREALAGAFGLIPHWAKDTKITKNTYNARSETVAEKPSFRDAWKKAQHCIIPAQAIYEPDWRSGRAVSTRIERSDGRPMGIAGLWSWWRAPDGNPLFSFTMLTVNADQHDFMRNFHKPEDEKRMVVILPEGSFGDWLNAAATDSGEFLNCFPADLLQATGVRMQKPTTTKPETESKAASATKTKIPPDSNLSLF
jgi:putative SOS response-associated peptidase YedK